MFRDNAKAEVNEKYFGAGSVVIGAGNEYYIVIAPDEYSVFLVDASDFQACTDRVMVEDVNCLSQKEAYKLVGFLEWATSDYTMNPKGFKGVAKTLGFTY